MLHSENQDIPTGGEKQDTDPLQEVAGASYQPEETFIHEKRKKDLTEKGKQYMIERNREKVNSSRLLLTKSISKALGLLQDSELHIVKAERVVIEENFKALSVAHQRHISWLTELYDIEEANVEFAKVTENYNKVLASINETIHRMESDELDSISMTSARTKKSSRSKYSSRSHRSTSSLKFVRSEAAADRASLDIELNYSHEENKLKLQLAAEELKTQELHAEMEANNRKLQAEMEANNRKLQAEMEAKMEANKRKLQAEKLKIQTEIQQLSLRRDRAKAHAREIVLAEFDSDSNSVLHKTIDIVPTPKPELEAESRSLLVTPEIPHPLEDPNVISSKLPPVSRLTFHEPVVTRSNPLFTPGFAPVAVSSNIDPGYGASSYRPYKARPVLPFEEPEVFHGDILQYPVWSSRFKDLIESNVTDPSRLISYLNKYTSGEANEAIHSFLVNPDLNSYKEAKRVLDTWYGDPDTITRAYKKKLKNWPVISMTDGGKGIRSFSNFLNSCKHLMTKSKFLSLEDDDLNQMLAVKLPRSSREKWAEIIAKRKNSMKDGDDDVPVREKQVSATTFISFCEHVEREAMLATQPVFGTAVLDQIVAENRKIHSPYKRKDFKSARTFATSSSDSKDQQLAPKTGSESVKEENCLYCHNAHGLHKCSRFKEIDYQSKVEFVRENRICFGCLKQYHVAKYCKSRHRCEVCKKLHPTVLHSDGMVKPKSQNSDQESKSETIKQKGTDGASPARCMMTGTDGIKSTRIVPVWIHHIEHPEKEIKTYCALDEHSDRTFISDQLVKKFDVQMHKVNLRITTLNKVNVVSSRKVKGLRVRGVDGPCIDLPSCYSTEEVPVSTDQIVSKSMIKDCSNYRDILDECVEIDSSIDVGILIGTDCIKALSPIQVITDQGSNSYAVKSLLGWSIVGLLTKSSSTLHCNRIETSNLSDPSFVPLNQTKELMNPMTVLKYFEQDFSEVHPRTGIMSASLSDKPISVEDKKFLEICENGIKMTDSGHYELPLPFRHEPKICNNKALAVKRLQSVKKRMSQDPKYRRDYCAFMDKIISKGHAVKVPKDYSGTPGQKWYLIHHGVYHPAKPDKIRVVYDGSAKFQGECLNDLLLPGPCLTNSIIGVLLRFRKGFYCFTADIEQMFYSVRLQSDYQDFFRFLWWEDGDTSKDPSEYKMTVHSFGVSSSPGCSIFALKKTAEDNENEFGAEVSKVIISSSYVDDILASCDSISESIFLTKSVKEICQRGGFNLTKFAANNTEILSQIPVNERCSEVKNIDMGCDCLPIMRTLGVEWCIESDSFVFRVSIKERPFTRRGLLGTICSIFDPCGYLAPLVLEGKLILQSMVKDKKDWDEPLPDSIRPRWEKWISELPMISDLKVRRCLKPEGFGKVKRAELHHFSDASNIAYGQCSYLRLIDEDNKIHCSFVIGKSRVAPMKFVTVPRLELTAAVVSVRIGKMLQQELEYENLTETYWTDSSVVLGYIANESKRFHTYIANRVEEIRSRSQPKDWFHVKTKDNVADDASRGLTAKEMTKDCRYLIGPSFLWRPLPHDAQSSTEFGKLNTEDPEVRKATVLVTKGEIHSSDLLEKMCYYSSWYKVLQFTTVMKRFIRYWKIKSIAKKAKSLPSFDDLKTPITVEEMSAAKSCVIKLLQKSAFQDELKDIQVCSDRDDQDSKGKYTVKKSSCIYKLHPVIDSNGILRIGGRLHLSSLPNELKHPIIIPKDHHMTKLLVRYFHEKTNHQGRGITHNEIRNSGFWIIGATRMISRCISNCCTCCKLRGQVVQQKMADLPIDRMKAEAPFTYCGMDIFGPWIIKQGRKELKRYGVLFTCLASRAVRIEVAPSLETDSFLNALRRFLCRNGPVRQIRCDRGSNFVGASRELQEAYKSMNHTEIQKSLLIKQCDYFPFKFNAPSASYQGGVWERQIRSCRAVLSSLLMKNGHQLDEDSLLTFMVEAENIVNSRPLTAENLTNPDGLLPLSPHNILTMKTRLVLPPAGIFAKPDMYLRKRWRRVQHLSNEFWQRWRKEYLQSLQERQKWNTTRRDLKINDIVIVVDENSPRNSWKLARIESVFPNEDGHVRRVLCRIAHSALDSKGRRLKDALLLERPIQKLILLRKAEEPGL